MQCPPELLPQALDQVGVLAGHDLGHLAGQDVGDRAAVAADGEGVADAFGAVGVAHADGAELEGAHLAMRAVGQHRRQRHAVEAGLELLDRRHRNLAARPALEDDDQQQEGAPDHRLPVSGQARSNPRRS